MKKNVIGHMTAPKESMGRRIRRWDILPRLVCLLFALIFWLLVVNVQGGAQEVPTSASLTVTEQSV